jgi:hypothetical protein
MLVPHRSLWSTIPAMITNWHFADILFNILQHKMGSLLHHQKYGHGGNTTDIANERLSTAGT